MNEKMRSVDASRWLGYDAHVIFFFSRYLWRHGKMPTPYLSRDSYAFLNEITMPDWLVIRDRSFKDAFKGGSHKHYEFVSRSFEWYLNNQSFLYSRVRKSVWFIPNGQNSKSMWVSLVVVFSEFRHKNELNTQFVIIKSVFEDAWSI